MIKKRIAELRAKVATNAHGLERGEAFELLDALEEAKKNLRNSRMDVLTYAKNVKQKHDKLVTYLEVLGLRHVAQAIREGKHLET